MPKISYAGCPNACLAISVQFSLKVYIYAVGHKKRGISLLSKSLPIID